MTASAEQNQLGDIAKVETHTAAIWAAVFARLVPDQVRFVCKTPVAHHLKTIGYQSVGYPKIQVGVGCSNLGHRNFADLFYR